MLTFDSRPYSYLTRAHTNICLALTLIFDWQSSADVADPKAKVQPTEAEYRKRYLENIVKMVANAGIIFDSRPYAYNIWLGPPHI